MKKLFSCKIFYFAILWCLFFTNYVSAGGSGHSRFGGLVDISATTSSQADTNITRTSFIGWGQAKESSRIVTAQPPVHDPIFYYYLHQKSREEALKKDPNDPGMSWAAVVAIIVANIATLIGLHFIIMTTLKH